MPDYQETADSAVIQRSAADTQLALNEDQQKAFDDILPRLPGGFSVNLIHGVTGSGKTELYLRCIQEVVAAGRRAIVLVPEIALTPQTVARFTARFARVAVLHSGLTSASRHRFWQQIAQGDADVVVGARSAVFAPAPNLGIMVIDEEHESSYKQDTAPRYHARDVAIKRGQLEGIPVLLGSATPSLESWWRAGASHVDAEKSPAARANFHLLSLPRRVRGLKLPEVELIDMRREAMSRPGVHLISQRLEHVLRATVDAGQQAILLLNHRGYSSFVYCAHCKEPIKCRFCDVTMTYHRSVGAAAKGATFEEGRHTGQLHCHYCLAADPLPAGCPVCNHKLSLFGLGTQRVEEELARRFPDIRFARVDSDTMRSSRDYEAVLGQFGKGEIQALLGTQMIAKGLDFPNVTLVGVISADTALSLPDFRAAERTFQLITQVAGRAGRGDIPGRVIVQSFMPEDPTIQSAIKQDYARFAAGELRTREQVGLPPIGRMVRIVVRDQDLAKAGEYARQLAAVIADAAKQLQAAGRAAKLIVKGPMPCAINRIAGHHRVQIVLHAPGAVELQDVLTMVRRGGGFAITDRVAVDVDPVSLL